MLDLTVGVHLQSCTVPWGAVETDDRHLVSTSAITVIDENVKCESESRGSELRVAH